MLALSWATLFMYFLHFNTFPSLGSKINCWFTGKCGLKDKYTHNTCQIYVKPHSKNTQITLESQIFDEKALR